MVVFFLPKSVLADGMAFEVDPYSDRWDYSDENNQQAFINYEEGLQKMIISVGIESKNNQGTVWLFPVPANPQKVAIDIIKELPKLRGEEISGKAKTNLDFISESLRLTQLYTMPFKIFGSLLLSSDADFGESFDGGNVSVYEHLEKEGIVSEIITAKTADGIYDYLKNKGLKIESGSISVLDNYIGKDFSFVVSWINSSDQVISAQEIKDNLDKYSEENYNGYEYPKFVSLLRDVEKKYSIGYSSEAIDYLKSPQGESALLELAQAIQKDPSIINGGHQKGVFVTFPTKDIYFPLLPTSVYGSKTVPATLRIIGHVSPKIFQDIKSYTKTEYYIDDYFKPSENFKNFYNKGGNNIKYTKIEINAPSKFLTDDLWISNHAPIKTYYVNFIANYPGFISIILLVLNSVLASILAGLLLFADLRHDLKKLGLIGLSNFLTLFGLAITTLFVRTKNKNEEVTPLLEEIKQRGYFGKRKFSVILFFISIPFLFLSLIVLLFLIKDIMMIPISHSEIYYLASPIIFIEVIFCVLSIAILIAALILNRIKPEDKNLFEQLKSAGYSSWSFQPKDIMKLAFVPVFSVFFMLISWLVIKLIEFTV